MYALIYPDGKDRPGLHMFNTHMQSNYDLADFALHKSIRMAQLRECVAFMHRKVLKHTDEKVRSFPVLFAGDFNVNARPNAASGPCKHNKDHSQEYMEMMEVLACFNGSPPVDVIYEKMRCHPVTCFDGSKRLNRDEVLTPPRMYDTFESDGRLDYIFMFDNSGSATDSSAADGSTATTTTNGTSSTGSSVAESSTTSITGTRVRVEEFPNIPTDYFKGQQLSDHYGLSMIL